MVIRIFPMKVILLISILALSFMVSFGQLPTVKNNKLVFPVKVNTDSGITRGFLWHVSDSVVFVSPYKHLTTEGKPQQLLVIPAENIQSFKIKKRKIDWAYPVAGSVLGFFLGAGLTVNDDVDDDGRTSFWELIVSAIEGSTSRNRARRNTALFVGLGGGLAGFGLGFFVDRGLTIRLPLFARKKGLADKRSMIENFIDGH